MTRPVKFLTPIASSTPTSPIAASSVREGKTIPGFSADQCEPISGVRTKRRDPLAQLDAACRSPNTVVRFVRARSRTPVPVLGFSSRGESRGISWRQRAGSGPIDSMRGGVSMRRRHRSWCPCPRSRVSGGKTFLTASGSASVAAGWREIRTNIQRARRICRRPAVVRSTSGGTVRRRLPDRTDDVEPHPSGDLPSGNGFSGRSTTGKFDDAVARGQAVQSVSRWCSATACFRSEGSPQVPPRAPATSHCRATASTGYAGPRRRQGHEHRPQGSARFEHGVLDHSAANPPRHTPNASNVRADPRALAGHH